MKNKFEQYFQDVLFKSDGDPKAIFRSWDFDKIVRESNQWRLPTRWLFVYVLANNCSFRTLHAHVGCAEDIHTRIAKHNGTISGGPSTTRKAAGHWKIIMYIIVPPYRNYSTKQMKSVCKKGRGWPSRCKKAIRMATKKGLHWRITRDIINQDSSYYTPAILETIKKQTNIQKTHDQSIFIEDETTYNQIKEDMHRSSELKGKEEISCAQNDDMIDENVTTDMEFHHNIDDVSLYA